MDAGVCGAVGEDAVTIKAIETEYNGYLFRSRLEARWAVFFDALGIEYSYELEGYDLDGLWYLPDFWLPQYRIWVEIKGRLDQESERKIYNLASQHEPVFVLSDIGKTCTIYCYDIGNSSAGFCPGGECKFAVCRNCQTVQIVPSGLDSHIYYRYVDFSGLFYCRCLSPNYEHPILSAAYKKAKQARFKRGT